jgi:hypothetical protein
MDRYDCRLHGSLSSALDLVIEVDVPVPLRYSPTDQAPAAPSAGLWGMVSVAVRQRHFLWIEDLIVLIEQGACPRPDASGSVEAMCRAISSVLAATGAFTCYKVVVKNIASGYATFASIEWPEPESPERLVGRDGKENGGGANAVAFPSRPPSTEHEPR